jgi:CRP-like cAMP-binding protein
MGYSHQELAELLGVYRETVTHVLSQLKARGWIDIQRKCIRLLDRARLIELSNR